MEKSAVLNYGKLNFPENAKLLAEFLKQEIDDYTKSQHIIKIPRVNGIANILIKTPGFFGKELVMISVGQSEKASGAVIVKEHSVYHILEKIIKELNSAADLHITVAKAQ